MTTNPNKTDAGNSSKAICCVSNVLTSPSYDPRRRAKNFEKVRRIPIYAGDLIGGIGLSRFDSWKLCRWRVGDGQPVKGSTIIAELECAIAVIEHEVFYSGTLYHKVAEGDSFLVSEPIGFIGCSDEEYSVNLQSESARRICVTLEPDELREVEALKSDESNEDFVARIFRAGLAQYRHNP